MISAKVILDSCNEKFTNYRIITLECTFPKFLQAQLNTHRVLSKNSASSRAIKFDRMVENILKDPVFPIRWGKNKPGMSADEDLDDNEQVIAKAIWQKAIDNAIESASQLNRMGVHKQTINRLIEPFFYTKVLVTSTEWDNFFKLRCEHSGAQDEMQDLAIKMREAIKNSQPQPLRPGQYHMPYIKPEEKDISLNTQKQISVARCARVSYLNFDGTSNIEDDKKLYNKLKSQGHWSPFEHIAMCEAIPSQVPIHLSRNFIGWTQYRALVDGG